MVRFECPDPACRTDLLPSDGQAGTHIACPVCQLLVEVPPAAVSPAGGEVSTETAAPAASRPAGGGDHFDAARDRAERLRVIAVLVFLGSVGLFAAYGIVFEGRGEHSYVVEGSGQSDRVTQRVERTKETRGVFVPRGAPARGDGDAVPSSEQEEREPNGGVANDAEKARQSAKKERERTEGIAENGRREAELERAKVAAQRAELTSQRELFFKLVQARILADAVSKDVGSDVKDPLTRANVTTRAWNASWAWSAKKLGLTADEATELLKYGRSQNWPAP